MYPVVLYANLETLRRDIHSGEYSDFTRIADDVFLCFDKAKLLCFESLQEESEAEPRQRQRLRLRLRLSRRHKL